MCHLDTGTLNPKPSLVPRTADAFCEHTDVRHRLTDPTYLDLLPVLNGWVAGRHLWTWCAGSGAGVRHLQLHPDLPSWMAVPTAAAGTSPGPRATVVPGLSAVVLVEHC